MNPAETSRSCSAWPWRPRLPATNAPPTLQARASANPSIPPACSALPGSDQASPPPARRDRLRAPLMAPDAPSPSDWHPIRSLWPRRDDRASRTREVPSRRLFQGSLAHLACAGSPIRLARAALTAPPCNSYWLRASEDSSLPTRSRCSVLRRRPAVRQGPAQAASTANDGPAQPISTIGSCLPGSLPQGSPAQGTWQGVAGSRDHPATRCRGSHYFGGW